MTYTAAAVERAMKAQDVILRALSGRQSWLAVADGLGVSPRTVRRWRLHYERHGYDGLLDRRRPPPSMRAVPPAAVHRRLRPCPRPVPRAVGAGGRRSGFHGPALLCDRPPRPRRHGVLLVREERAAGGRLGA